MLENIEVLFHSSIRMGLNKVIYIDPYQIKKEVKDADIVFITHSHYDHFSEEDIEKVKNDNTIFVAPEDVAAQLLRNGILENNIIALQPGDEKMIGDIRVEAIPAYNVNKPFHPKSNLWLGFVITVDSISYYIAGDTDLTEENKKVSCDVAFVPVGGTYTMNAEEAAKLVNIIKPQIAIPIHYGSVVGTKKDAEHFIKLLDSTIQGKILMKK